VKQIADNDLAHNECEHAYRRNTDRLGKEAHWNHGATNCGGNKNARL